MHATVSRRLGGVAAPLAVLLAANTGKIGDGKVFVVDLEQAMRIRTGELGEAAL